MSHDLPVAVALNGYGLERYEPDGFFRDVLSWSDLRETVVMAEGLGYRGVFMPQQWAWEPLATLAALAGETERMSLASGVLPLDARDPRELVLGATSVQAISEGRFALGLGAASSMAATREQVIGIRDALRGNEGSLPEARMVLGPLDRPPTSPVPVYLAALGPRMVALAGEVADGVILNWCNPERVAEARAAIGNRDDFILAVYVRAGLSHVDDHALEALQVTAARYVLLDHYARQLEAIGLGKDLRAARTGLERDGHPRDVVSERLLEATCVWGDRERALARLGEYHHAGADLVVVYPVPAGEAVSSIAGTMMAAAPEPAVEA